MRCARARSASTPAPRRALHARPALSAAALPAAALPHAFFVCVGSGPRDYADRLKALARSLGLDDRLLWAGERGDIRAACNAFDVATSSSAYGEGFSNAICEAMACGVPVAATGVGDASVIVGDTGEIVPVRRPDLLSAAWVRLRQRLNETPGLGAAARGRVVSNFSVKAMVRETESVLLRVAGGAR